jgi:iron complex transport system ATP-binding protein
MTKNGQTRTGLGSKKDNSFVPSRRSPLMATAKPYLEMCAVESWHGPRQVFRDLSLTLFQGEHTAVLGPNGSGKSSLIKLLSRELYPVVKTGSSLRLFGEDTINLWRLRTRMGVLSQESKTSDRHDVRVRDVVLSGFFGSVGLGRSQQPTVLQRRRVETLLRETGLADLRERPFSHLSEGQKRRVLLARARVHKPEVLVLDEPTNGLDILARHHLLQDLGQRARTGTTLLLVSHRIEEIIPEIQRVVLLKEGTVVGDGPTDDLLRDGPLSALFGLPLRVLSSGGSRQVLPVGASGTARLPFN